MVRARSVLFLCAGLCLGSALLPPLSSHAQQQQPAPAPSAPPAPAVPAPAAPPAPPAPAAPAAPPSAPSPADSLRQLLAGTFVPAPGVPNRQQLEAGVDRAVGALFVLIRPLARSRILDGNPLFPTLEFLFDGRRIEVRSPPVIARSLDDGPAWRMVGLDRNQNNVTQRFTNDALVQTCWNDAGRRVTRFVPSADGSRVTLNIEVTAPQLPVPVRYQLQYARR